MRGFDSESLNEILARDNPTGYFKDGGLSSLPESWVTDKRNIPTMCPECDRFASHSVNKSEGVVKFNCDGRCNLTADLDEFTQYKVDYMSVIDDLCSSLGVEPRAINDDLPRYVSADVSVPLQKDDEDDNPGEENKVIKDAEVRIIISPHDFGEEIRNALFEISLSDKPSLVFVNADRISELLEIQSLYASGDLIHITTTTNIPSARKLNKRVREMCRIKSLEEEMKENLTQSSNSEMISRVDSNPRYILTELNHMLSLRDAGEIEDWEGDRLEKVTESAFSHIFATLQGEGGQDDNFEKMPDTVFFIGELNNNTDPRPMDPILGIIDTKSGSPAGFAGEKIEGKQIDYVSAARKRSVPVEKVAHIFVTTRISSLNDIDFYDRIKSSYGENEFMVVLTVEGLMQLMDIYLSSTISDRIKLETNTFARAARSLFDPDEYYEIGNGNFTRETVQASDQEEYDERYSSRHGLLLITPEVVQNNFMNYIKEDPDIGDIMETFLKNIDQSED